ncbi:hypothetical protein LY76DRAFT_106692 [Colletotrichum caudatum]|nr:hypothetical protein LY76DRAFT_106692 [Colletotrichum caudatum]
MNELTLSSFFLFFLVQTSRLGDGRGLCQRHARENGLRRVNCTHGFGKPGTRRRDGEGRYLRSLGDSVLAAGWHFCIFYPAAVCCPRRSGDGRLQISQPFYPSVVFRSPFWTLTLKGCIDVEVASGRVRKSR